MDLTPVAEALQRARSELDALSDIKRRLGHIRSNVDGIEKTAEHIHSRCELEIGRAVGLLSQSSSQAA
jgi:hypothetical protein